jgi:outer membrane protein assembly factor BamD
MVRPAAILVLLSGCATMSVPELGTDVRDSGRRTYYDGMTELVAGNHVQAGQIFAQVSRSPRYAHYVALARLRAADSLVLQERYEEAVQLYRSFISQHESNPNVPYAQFRIAQCYVERLPDEWFLSPPAEEMEQTMSEEAERELRAFLQSFPLSDYAPKARQMLSEVRRLLFDRELYVADFYERREKWRAVAWRLHVAIDQYPEFGLTADLVWRMATAYNEAGDRAQAAQAYGLYLEKFPDGAERSRAKERLEAIRRDIDSSARESGESTGEARWPRRHHGKSSSTGSGGALRS